jgi:hypothetical protein
MAFQAATFYNASYKRINRKAHTSDDKEAANEARLSQVSLDVSQIIGEKVDADPNVAKDINVEYVLCEMYVDTSSNGKCWIAKFPAAYSGYFGVGAQGDDIADHTFAVPATYGTGLAESDHSAGYAPKLFDDAVHHAEPGAEDYFFDPFACAITSEDDLDSGSTWTLGIYVYTGSRATRIHRSTAAPGVGDDDADGFDFGSIWIKTSATKAVYLCLDPSTGAADWDQIDIGGITAHASGDGSDHADVATNTTHSGGDGSDHADVATNTTHSSGDGSDHADVATNTTHRGLTNNPHATDVENLGAGTLAELNAAISDETIVGRDTTDTLTAKTLTTPTIGSFTNAQHDHDDAAGGGALAAKFRRQVYPFFLAEPSASEDMMLDYISDDVTISEIFGITSDGTFTFNVYARSKTSPDAGGTKVLTSDLTCDSGGDSATSGWNDNTITGPVWLYLVASAITDAPGWVTGFALATID